MARHYKYITFSDRREIAALYQANERPADIADRLGVTTATIYRELKRGETVGEDGAPVLDRNRRRAYKAVIAARLILSVAKYSGLTLAGIILFRAGAAYALTERGYSAVGGKAFAPFLPVFYALFSGVGQGYISQAFFAL